MIFVTSGMAIKGHFVVNVKLKVIWLSYYSYYVIFLGLFFFLSKFQSGQIYIG